MSLPSIFTGVNVTVPSDSRSEYEKVCDAFAYRPVTQMLRYEAENFMKMLEHRDKMEQRTCPDREKAKAALNDILQQCDRVMGPKPIRTELLDDEFYEEKEEK